MSAFKTFFMGLPAADREGFAARAQTSAGYLQLVAYGKKPIELGIADVLVKLGEGAFKLEDLPLTERAQRQDAIRNGRPLPGSPPPDSPTTAPGALDETAAAQ